MKALTLFSSFVLVFSVMTTGFSESIDELVSGELLEQCAYPTAPSIPNGKSATEQELIASQTNMKSYLAEGNGFIDCLKAIEESWEAEEAEEKSAFVVMFHNKIVDEMNEVAELFNAAVRAFKGKN